MRWIALALVLAAACGEPETAPAPESESERERIDRDEWWTAATRTPLGSERLLAPRELRALLAEGRKLGFDADPEWWKPKATWAYERILLLDPDDVEANAAAGRKTLRSIPGFDALWQRMLEAKVFNKAIEELIEQYHPWIESGRPVFLEPGEIEIVRAKMRKAGEHLDRMENDLEYAALQVSLERIPSQLKSYPSIHVRAGPFLVFFAARDLERIPGADDASEDERLRVLTAKYEKELEERCAILPALLADIEEQYPKLARRHTLAKDDFFFLWIFGDPEWYNDFLEALRIDDRPEHAYRCGFFQKRDMWGYMYKPRAPEIAPVDEGEEAVQVEIPDPETQLRETMAYVACKQLLRHWARDPEEAFTNRLDKSRAYWLKEGWPAWMAARRVEKSLVGPSLREAVRFGREPPPLHRIVERQSRIELHRYREPDPPIPAAGNPALNVGIRRHFTDLAWLLVDHLNRKEHRDRFEAYLIAQIEATAEGTPDGFAQAFALDSAKAWEDLEYALYDRLYDER